MESTTPNPGITTSWNGPNYLTGFSIIFKKSSQYTQFEISLRKHGIESFKKEAFFQSKIKDRAQKLLNGLESL